MAKIFPQCFYTYIDTLAINKNLNVKLWLKIPVHGQTWILVTLLFPQCVFFFFACCYEDTWLSRRRKIHRIFTYLRWSVYFCVFHRPPFKKTLCSHNWSGGKKVHKRLKKTHVEDLGKFFRKISCSHQDRISPQWNSMYIILKDIPLCSDLDWFSNT